MKDLIHKIEALQEISEVLEPSETKRAEYHRQILDFSNDFIGSIHEVTTYNFVKRPLEGLGIDGHPKPLSQILGTYQSEVVNHGLNPASGGHIGYIPGGGIYASAIADYIADVSNEYAGMYFGSPGAVTIENETLDWLKSVFGFPKTAVGNLTSGGSIANLIALTAARDKHGIKGDKIASSVIYLSEQVHHCVHKALRIIGLEDIIIRHISLDGKHRMDMRELAARINTDEREGLNPFMIIASAGTTDTGAIDPLADIANIASEMGMWFHIDAAYGGFFILCESKKQLFQGIEEADSLVIDPHKGLFLPYGTGAVLVKDREAVMRSHHYTANYMQDAYSDNYPINPADVSPELTKHFRGLRLWLPLQLYGLKPFIACLEEKLLLTTYFRNRLLEMGFKVGPDPDLSVSYFWYPFEGNEYDFNERLMQLIHEDGSVFLSSTVLNGRFVIRMAILAFRTKIKTIDRAISMIERALNTLQKTSKKTIS